MALFPNGLSSDVILEILDLVWNCHHSNTFDLMKESIGILDIAEILA